MHSLQLFKKSRSHRDGFNFISSIDHLTGKKWLDNYYNIMFYMLIIGVPVISALFWTSFENLALAPAEPWLSFYVPASIFIAVMAMLLAFAGWIYHWQRVARILTPENRTTPTPPRVNPLDAEQVGRTETSAFMASTTRSETPLSAVQEPETQLKVLVVDDDACNRMILRKQLMQLGLESQSAEDGMAAVEAALHEHWDLILMDGQMPNMDGIEATREIRTHSRINADTVIVAVTSNTCHGYRERCLASGMNGFCNKPLNAVALQELIRSYVKPGKQLS